VGALPEGMPWPSSNRLVSHRQSDTFHAYVHIPFCEVRCGYCDFNTYTQSELGDVRRSEFHLPLIREMEFARQVIDNSGISLPKLSSVFFGGGTPSLMAANQIASLMQSLGQQFGIESDAEVTLEANPESTSPELLESLRAAGVNRISFGAQSFDVDVLKVLDRTHRPELLSPLVRAAKELGFRTSVDLIYGAPGEMLESWRMTLQQALELGTEHISAYSLIVEDGTKLAAQIRRGEFATPDEDLNAAKHEIASELFSRAGLEWYEISNWGEPSTHNIAYWQSKNWWGFGPGAHSHIDGNRFWNRKHPLAYQQSLDGGSPVQGFEEIDAQTHLIESVMLRLRTRFGLPRSSFSELGIPADKVASYLAEGLLTMNADVVTVTAKGRLLVDGIALDLVSSVGS